MPEDLRGDETLALYADIPVLAKAHTEIRKWAGGRVAIPAADDAQGFAEFVTKVRPADAADYKIVDADGKPSEIGERFRPVFHGAGLHPLQAEQLIRAWNQDQADQLSKHKQAGKDELTAIELNLGGPAYHQRLTAVDNMLRAVGVEVDDLAPALEQVAGAGKAMEALFKLAESTGELAKVDGATVALRMGAMTKQAAQTELDAMAANKDEGFQKAVRTPGSPEHTKRAGLLARLRQDD